MKYLFLILFIVFSVLHLIASFNDDAEKRKKTKPFLLIWLLLYYVFSTDNLSVFLVLALFFSWLGDVLLIPKGHKWFAFGGISFMFSHLFFILAYTNNFEFKDLKPVVLVIAGIVYFGTSFKIMRELRVSTPKSMIFPMFFYLMCNSTMNMFALMQMMSRKDIGSVVAYIGAVLFFISDCTLFLVRYYKNKDIIYKKHFTVMLTYLLGEFLITLGILMMRG